MSNYTTTVFDDIRSPKGKKCNHEDFFSFCEFASELLEKRRTKKDLPAYAPTIFENDYRKRETKFKNPSR